MEGEGCRTGKKNTLWTVLKAGWRAWWVAWQEQDWLSGWGARGWQQADVKRVCRQGVQQLHWGRVQSNITGQLWYLFSYFSQITYRHAPNFTAFLGVGDPFQIFHHQARHARTVDLAPAQPPLLIILKATGLCFCSKREVAWIILGINTTNHHTLEHKCFKCWWLALPEKKRITKPLINSTIDHGLHEGPSYTVLTIIKELLKQFKSWSGLLPNCIISFMFGSLK